MDLDNDSDWDKADRSITLATGSIAPEPIALIPDGVSGNVKLTPLGN